MQNVLVAGVLLASMVPAQNLVADPHFKTPSAWRIVNQAQTKIVRWAPLTIELKVGTSKQAGRTVGVQQAITVPRAGWYQLIMHADTSQIGQTGSIPFDCSLRRGSVKALTASGSANQGPDTRMQVARLSAGKYNLTVTSKTVLDTNAAFQYRIIDQAVFLRPVKLPCPSWRLKTHPTWWARELQISGTFSPGTVLAVYMLSSHRLASGVSIPGIGGQLLLDPAHGTGIVLSALMPVGKSLTVSGWPVVASHAL